MFCREQAAHYQNQSAAFDELGVKLAAIGNGTAPMANEFVTQFNITFPVYTDPKRHVYRAAGMNYQMGFKLATLKHAARAMKGGFRQGLTKGRAMQQGGVIVVDTQGDLRFEYQEDGPGEHLNVEHVLQTVRALDL